MVPRRLLSLMGLLLALALLPAAPALAQSPHPYYDDPAWLDSDIPLPDVDVYVPPVVAPVPVPSRPSRPSHPTTPAAPPTPAQPLTPTVPLVTTGTVPGRLARLRTDGRAAIPTGAPRAVRAIIAAANQIIGKPYKWGGGHAKLVDRGYDCSGTVSYALIRAGLLSSPMVSGTFARWGSAGPGRWTAIYANAGHVYMEVAGLRLDTSAVGDPAGRSGVRWRPPIGKRRGFHTRHVTGL
jgi:hypothetical protein